MAQTLTKVCVLGRKVSVKRVTEKQISVLAGDKDCYGFFDGEVIYINRSLSKTQFKRVFIHELIHAMFHISGLTNLLDSNTEEALCDATESLLELFHNKAFVKFLSKED